MNRQEEEQEQAGGPGAAARKAALGVIDVFLAFFQRQHDRFAGPESRDDRRSRAPGEHEPEGTAAPTRPSLLRKLLIWLLLLLAGLGAGGYLAYRTLSLQLKEHDSVVERMQEEVDAVRKEDARNVKLLDKFQRENAAYRAEAREAQREAEIAKARSAELEEEIESMKRAEQAAREARQAAAAKARAKASAPPKGAKCTVGTAAEIAACIERFNRP